jgi:uncharacterized membrane protein (DUF2068 family)
MSWEGGFHWGGGHRRVSLPPPFPLALDTEKATFPESPVIMANPPAPPSIDTTAPLVGLRAIAVFEAAKGALVLLVGVGLLSLLHRDAGAVAAQLVRRLHLNPARHYPMIFLQAAATVTDAKLWALAAGATAYATVRFIEACGLWQRRVWAEWFALLSTSLYLPVELYELVEHRTPTAAVVLLSNTLIVLYLLYCRLAAMRSAP